MATPLAFDALDNADSVLVNSGTWCLSPEQYALEAAACRAAAAT
jgi:hypothetical protein